MKQKIDNLDNYVNELKEILGNRNEEITEWKNRCEKLDQQNKKIQSQLAQKREEHDKLMQEHKHLEELLNNHLQSAGKKEKEIQILNSKVNDVSLPFTFIIYIHLIIYYFCKHVKIFLQKIK